MHRHSQTKRLGWTCRLYARERTARLLDALAARLGKSRLQTVGEAILAYAKKHGITSRMIRPDGTIADPRSSYGDGVPGEPTDDALESGYADEREQAVDYRDQIKGR